MKDLLKRIRMELEDAPYKHPNIPLALSFAGTGRTLTGGEYTKMR